MKKDNGSTFDVTVGSYDGAEVCELVGIYILSILSKKYEDAEFGLYRDDGLAAFQNINSQASDHIRKEIIEIFKQLGLKITIQCNLNEVNSLDISLNLNEASYRPYRRPNDHPQYIHRNSNHPQSKIKQLPQNIGKRISEISATKEIFDRAAPYCNEALKASGFKDKIKYEPSENHNPNAKPNRKRNIIWFNPPYSANVKTNVGKKFILLVDKHFPKEHKLNKIFNRSSVKVSYSCMPNMSTIVKSHNRKVLHPEPENNAPNCNCREKELCPLQGKCLSESIIYRAKITNDKTSEPVNYIGLTELTFKDRLYKHRHNTNIRWSILDKASTFRNGSQRCNLCLTEKYHIIFQNIPLLNKRNELLSNCLHINKFLLRNYKDIPPDN